MDVTSGTTPARPRAPRVPTLEPAVERKIARAWAGMLDQADAIGDDITLTLIERDPYWSEQRADRQADLRASTREHVRRGIRAMAGLADPDQRATDFWRETGKQRARQGVPMDRVLNAYTLGTRTLWEALLRQGWERKLDIEEHVLLLAGQKLWAALDVQNAVLVDSYRREAARLQRRNLQRQQNFLDGLVEGRGADPEFAREAREELGLGPDEAVACVVAPFDDPLDEPLRAPEDRLERLGVSSHWHVRGGNYFGLVPCGLLTVAQLVGALNPSVAGRVGLAHCPDGLTGFATAYQLASRAAESLPRGTPRLVSVADRLPEVLLAGSPEVVPVLVAETVGPLLQQPGPQAETLLRTLSALLASDGSPTHAAEALYCHRNTVIYRMKQIESLTGRCLQRPRDKLELTLGLLATGRDLEGR
ncbi:PucR C-terminal helix-turn-helix domain-containing protein [Amycolatopsis arida]|uniref:PucR C-terminal helix-turn-helix domain-containing protein n=1 Tax=Amycolatopsis arida TaxID=587909 RepID=A0A1I5MCV5_9PSEU|nr:helix-turn-helix domain-containing protein [Amycolatopsis arida]TDX94052.1 PucR-like helix-turn-helix protein [Amycolatopsis arida]SFP07434.1 PucR C-terminal helix-turn-helix domain-containing protein [Amycolatopsis arida]